MGNAAIRLFTVAEVTGNTEALAGYADPANLITAFDDGWRHRLISNVDGGGDDPALMLGLHGDRVVVRLAFYSAEVQYEQKRFRTYWLCGFFRDPSHPDRAIAGRLFLQALSRCGSVVACGSPAPRTRELYRAAGLREMERLQRYVYFYRTAPIVEKYVRSRLLAVPLAVATDPLRRLYYAVRSCRWRPVLTFHPVARFSADLDSLLIGDTRNCFVKSSAKLNWVLDCRSSEAFEIRRNGRLAGYCILRQRVETGGGTHSLPTMSIGCLSDYYLDDASPASREDLLHWAIRHFRGSGAEVFECQAQEPALLAACSRLALARLGGHYVFLKLPRGVESSSERPWFYTHGTGDVLIS